MYFPLDWGVCKTYDVNQNNFIFTFQKNIFPKMIKSVSIHRNIHIHMQIQERKDNLTLVDIIKFYITPSPEENTVLENTLIFCFGEYISIHYFCMLKLTAMSNLKIPTTISKQFSLNEFCTLFRSKKVSITEVICPSKIVIFFSITIQLRLS